MPVNNSCESWLRARKKIKIDYRKCLLEGVEGVEGELAMLLL